LFLGWLILARVCRICGPSSYLYFVGVGFVDAPSVSAEFALCNYKYKTPISKNKIHSILGH
jgi:hypothetical protein